jgi:hypothetical protein
MHNSEEIKEGFLIIKKHFELINKVNKEKKRKGSSAIFNFMLRKSKNTQEKCLRSIINIASEKKIIEMQFKMLQRVLIKIVSRRMKQNYQDLIKGIEIKEKRSLALQYI